MWTNLYFKNPEIFVPNIYKKVQINWDKFGFYKSGIIFSKYIQKSPDKFGQIWILKIVMKLKNNKSGYIISN